MAEVAACCGSGSKRLLAHIWVHQEAECRGHCQSAGFHPFSPLSIYSGPPAYGMLLPTFQSGSLLLALSSLETSSQQESRVCLLGDSKPNQGNTEDSPV